MLRQVELYSTELLLNIFVFQLVVYFVRTMQLQVWLGIRATILLVSLQLLFYVMKKALLL